MSDLAAFLFLLVVLRAVFLSIFPLCSCLRGLLLGLVLIFMLFLLLLVHVPCFYWYPPLMYTRDLV